jgi:hypothetical protein
MSSKATGSATRHGSSNRRLQPSRVPVCIVVVLRLVVSNMAVRRNPRRSSMGFVAENQVRRRLFAGARGIRTLGPSTTGLSRKVGLTIAAKGPCSRITKRRCRPQVSTSVLSSITLSGGMRRNSVSEVSFVKCWRVDLGGQAAGSINQSQQVSTVIQTAFPIGWRPVFISLQHLNETLEIQIKGPLADLETNLSAENDLKFG